MRELSEFFSSLFNTSDWPARWQCGYWSNFHGWLYIISELLIWTAYFLIPLIILNYLFKKKTALKYNKAYVYFAAFILLCGSTHFFDALMFWVPMYRLNALLRFATAVVSLATVYHLIKILPEAFKQKTSLELENEIARREAAEAQLAESNKKLADANKDLEAFAYIASHDLQEPLRKIQMYSSMLLRSAEGTPNEQSLDLAQKISNSSARMQTMVSDVLTLSTVSDQAPLAPVKLNDAVADALDHLEIKILEKNASIQVGELGSVLGNQAYLTLMFLNLIGNAVKFTRGRPEIQIKAEHSNGMATVSVADNGIGIRKEDVPVIFGAFRRLHAKTEYEGTGIGLAVCKRIVDVHNGTITVESELNKGTKFIIALPAAPASRN